MFTGQNDTTVIMQCDFHSGCTGEGVRDENDKVGQQELGNGLVVEAEGIWCEERGRAWSQTNM